jgi:predicted RNase H-like nuclease (RuvC/YqgF family)
MWRALVLAIVMLPSQARAQDSAEDQLRLLPEYTPCVVSGVRYACYTAEQQAQLNALEITARGLRAQLRISEELRVDLDRLILNLQQQQTQRDEIITLLRAQIEELNRHLMEEIEAKNRYRAEAESGPDTWPLWVGGIVGLLGLGFGVGAAIAAL